MRKGVSPAGRPGRSTDVTLEDGDEGTEVAPALGGVFHILDAVMCVRVDYFLVVDPESLEPIADITGQALVAVAAYLGATRLIDNIVVKA